MTKKKRKPEQFLEKTQLKGNKDAFKNHLVKHLKYPKEAIENKVEGVVVLKLDIADSGKVIKSKVVQGIGHGCDEEAQRVASLLEFTPTNNKKKRVTFHRTIRIPFKLNFLKPKPTQISYSYSIKKKDHNETPKGGASYTFTIDVNKKP